LVKANIVREQDGIPMLYKEFKRGFGIRIVHPQNPKAPSKNLSVQMLYVAPGGRIEPHSHENEEVYILIEGTGKGFFGTGKPIDIAPVTFFHLPANAEHGLENTGDTMMKLITTTSPPFGIWPEWEIVAPKKAKGKK
jgi:mannose-6-phosphate isomerase-like protein (cupin superfamily)